MDLVRRQKPGEIFRERTNIQAQHYMILKSPKAFSTSTQMITPSSRDGLNTSGLSKAARMAAWKVQAHQNMWQQALDILSSVDAAFADAVTAIAFTKNFVGSPHIDTQNTGPFYGLSMGDFKAPGGALCVEISAREVGHVDTRHRLGKVDGRYPHWVAPYEGNRYSVIFYQTAGNEIPRETAVFQGNEAPLVDDPTTFPATPDDRYYNCYDKTTGTYAPSGSGLERAKTSSWRGY
jgi:hypothetical protein